MELPECFLPRPVMNLSAETVAAFEALFAGAVKAGPQTPIAYTLPNPKWQFLCWLCENKSVVLHGSGTADIEEFEPRQSNDVDEFGNRRAIYAASDGIWPLYFAVVNRNCVTSLVNGCFRVLESAGRSEPYYYFSINAEAFQSNPWRDGMIYLLPGESFEPQPLQNVGSASIEIAQWASPVPVTPLAKLAVMPDDFPFLAQTVPHDPATLRERAQANPSGFPWHDE